MNWDYVAGFFDGEGCIAITKDNSRKFPRFPCTVRVTISQKRPAVLSEIKGFLKENRIPSTMFQVESMRNDKRFDCWLLSIGKSKHAVSFLLKIKDKLIVKRPEAIRVLNIWGYTRESLEKYDVEPELEGRKLVDVFQQKIF